MKYKHKCVRCKKNYVLISSYQKYPLCYDCQKNELGKEVRDPEMKKLFDIPEEFYKENFFLRSIKINYLRYGSLTDKQIGAFKKTVKKMGEENKNS